MRSHRLSRVVGVVLALSLIAGACGSDDDKKGTTAKAPVDKTTVDINATPRDELKQGGTFRYPISGYPATFNPYHVDLDADSNNIISSLLPGPFLFDGEAKPVLYDEYVLSAEVTSTDPQVITYELNPKAIWYDGSEITVADYEALWKALRTAEGTDYQIISSNGYDQVESVKAGKDDHEVVVTFKRPYADWQAMFGGLLPASTSNDPKIFNEGWTNQPLTTAGPYKLEKADAAAKTVTLVPNEKWWGDKPKLDKIVFITVDVDAQIDSLANGEVDFVDIGPAVDTYTRAKGLAGVTVRRAGGPNFRHITFNGTSPVLQDVNVRRALAMAIDRKTIARAMIGPLGESAEALNNHIFMANQDGYKNNAGDLATVNPEKAKSLLETAGWKLNGTDTIRTKDGKQLVVRMVIPSQVATSEKEATLIAGMFEAVGAKLDIQVVPSDPFFEDYITPGNFDITVFSWIGTPFPISSSKSIYAKPTGSGEDLDIQQNYARVGSEEIDRLFDEATSELDRDKAIDIANKIDKLIWDEVHSLANYQRPNLVATKNTLANFGAFGFASVVWEDIGFTK